MSKVELFAAIRRDSRAEGLSIRGLARKYRVHRRLVREALGSAWPTPRKPSLPRRWRLDPFKPLIDQMLREDLDAPRKQRHTATRVYDRLVVEHGMQGVSYSRVRAYVAERYPEIRVEAGRGPPQVFIPPTPPARPGGRGRLLPAAVVLGQGGAPDLCVRGAGGVLRRPRARVQGAWWGAGGQDPLRQLEVGGGAGAGLYPRPGGDRPVDRVSLPLWDRGLLLPAGQQGAHEKGGVEGEVGRFRRNHLVPVPEVASLADLNQRVEQWDADDDAQRIGSRPRTVGEYFAAEQPLLKALSEEAFATGRLLTPRVDRYAQITVRTTRYSVPVRLIGRQVRVLLGASELVVYDGRVEVAQHKRLSA
jgi:hypothetical protein